MEAKKYGINKIILPKENSKEATIIDDIEVIGVQSLKEVIEYLNNKIKIEPVIKEVFKPKKNIEKLDFSEVKGQNFVKRGLEIAATGGHNVCLIGSPRLSEKQCLQKECLQYCLN